jgi:Predicted membrane protein
MNEFLLVTIKLLIGFLALIMVINVTGKGNLAPSSASDQVQNFVLGGIIGGVIYNKNVQILEYIGILCIWCILVLLLKLIKTYSVKAKQVLDGKAFIIIDHGQINIENCKKVGLSAHDVSFKLRTNHIYSTRKVKRALMEQNGQLIIVQDGEENPKFPLITDGQLQTDILDVIGKNETWLLEEMKKQGLNSYGDVFLGEYTDGHLALTPYPSKKDEVKN